MPNFERPAIGDTPRWATGPGESVTEPLEAKKDTGHVTGDASSDEMNWLQRQTYRWLGWLAERTAQVGDFGVRFVGGVYGAAVDLVHPGVTGEGAGNQPGVLAEGDAAPGLEATTTTGDSAVYAYGVNLDAKLVHSGAAVYGKGLATGIRGIGWGLVGGGKGGEFTGGASGTAAAGAGITSTGGASNVDYAGGPGAILEGGGGVKPGAPLRLVEGAPHTPVNGDVWFDGALLKFHINGTTYTVATV